MPNLKEIDSREGCLWLAQSYFCKMVRRRRRRKGEENGAIFRTHISRTNGPISLKFGIAYMEGTKYVNLIDIGSVVIEIRGVENVELTVPINTLVCHTAFLAADTRPCVLAQLTIEYLLNINYNYIIQDLFKTNHGSH